MERGRFVECHAGDLARPLARHAQRDRATIGMANEVHGPSERIDHAHDRRCLVGEREGMMAAPMPGPGGADEMWAPQRGVAWQHPLEVLPLPGTPAGAMQRDDV